MSLYTDHVARWRDCRLCPLWEKRNRVVLARGSLPCTVLFVGEAPGPSENVLGQPFVGPAGQLLDRIIDRAGLNGTMLPEGEYAKDDQPIRYALTNLVACIPLDEEGDKFAEPEDASIKACAARLVELIAIARPRLIVQVGKLAKTWLTPGYKHSLKIPFSGPTVDIIHPAAILRLPAAQRTLAVQRSTVVLRNAVESLVDA